MRRVATAGVSRKGPDAWVRKLVRRSTPARSIAFATGSTPALFEQVEWFTLGRQSEFEGERGMDSGLGHIQRLYVRAPGYSPACIFSAVALHGCRQVAIT